MRTLILLILFTSTTFGELPQQKLLNQITDTSAVKAPEQVTTPAETNPEIEKLQRDIARMERILNRENIYKMEFPFPPLPHRLDRLSLGELSQLVRQYQNQISALKAEAQRLEVTRQNFLARRLDIPKQVQELKARLQEAVTSTEPGKAPASDTESSRINELKLLLAQKELLGFDQRDQMIQETQSLLKSQLAKAESSLEQLLSVFNKVQASEDAIEQVRAEKKLKQLEGEDPYLVQLANENLVLAQENMSANQSYSLDEVRDKIASTQSQIDKTRQDFTLLQRKVKSVGMTRLIGLLLIKQKGALPHSSEIYKSMGENQQYSAGMQVLALEIEEKIEELQYLSEGSVSLTLPSSIATRLGADQKKKVMDLFQARRSIHSKHLDTINRALMLRADLESVQLRYYDLVQEYQNYIDQNILWVQSDELFDWQRLAKASIKVHEALSLSKATIVASHLKAELRYRPVPYLVSLIILAFLWFLGSRIRKINLAAKANKQRSELLFSLRSLLYALIQASPLPALLYSLAYALEGSAFQLEVHSIAHSLQNSALLLLLLSFIKRLIQPDGLGVSLFRWSEQGVKIVRISLKWLTPTLVVSYFLFSYLEALPSNPNRLILSRALFYVYIVSLFGFLIKDFGPNREWVSEMIKKNQGGWLNRFKWAWYPLMWLLPAALIVISYLGYHYASIQLTFRLHRSLVWILSLLLIRSIIYRILLGWRQAWLKEQKKDSADSGLNLDQSEIRFQLQRFLQNMTAILAISGLWVIWSEILPALAILNQVELWKIEDLANAAEGAEQVKWRVITLGHLLLCFLILLLTFVAYRNLPALLEISVLRILNLEAAQSYATVTVFRYILILIGFGFACSALGIYWKNVQWLAAAFTVGLGFGLQEIFANFVAGLILLFEQPIRVNDIVTLGEVYGTVTKIQIRATTLEDWDKKEVIIPNKEFITSKLINWTLSDPILRLVLPLGVSYSSDPEKVKKVLMKVATDYEVVLKDPAPSVLFKQFGDSSLNFDLRVYFRLDGNYAQTLDTLNTRIFQAFREEGIEIPFPQRDLHLKSGFPPAPQLKDIVSTKEE